jgi:hypothetical protein
LHRNSPALASEYARLTAHASFPRHTACRRESENCSIPFESSVPDSRLRMSDVGVISLSAGGKTIGRCHAKRHFRASGGQKCLNSLAAIF